MSLCGQATLKVWLYCAAQSVGSFNWFWGWYSSLLLVTIVQIHVHREGTCEWMMVVDAVRWGLQKKSNSKFAGAHLELLFVQSCDFCWKLEYYIEKLHLADKGISKNQYIDFATAHHTSLHFLYQKYPPSHSQGQSLH